MCTAQLKSSSTHFKCSVVPCDWWLPYWKHNFQNLDGWFGKKEQDEKVGSSERLRQKWSGLKWGPLGCRESDRFQRHSWDGSWQLQWDEQWPLQKTCPTRCYECDRICKNSPCRCDSVKDLEMWGSWIIQMGPKSNDKGLPWRSSSQDSTFSLQGARVQFLVKELRSYMCLGMAKYINT